MTDTIVVSGQDRTSVIRVYVYCKCLCTTLLCFVVFYTVDFVALTFLPYNAVFRATACVVLCFLFYSVDAVFIM